MDVKGLNYHLAPDVLLSTVELAAVIVENDADMDSVVDSLLKGGFYHAGQVCVSVQRIYVHIDICKQLAEKLSSKAQLLKVGDPDDIETDVGPLILPKEVDRVEAWVDEAKAAGAIVLCGGKRLSDYCYLPTVLLNPPKDAQVSKLEIFGSSSLYILI